eukprot:gene2650-3290_t
MWYLCFKNGSSLSSKSYIPFSVLISFVLTLTISLALGGLLFWQLYLIFTNQTTIEFLHNRTQHKKAKSKGEIYTNPFNLGWKDNFKEFFGTGKRWYLFAMPTLQKRDYKKWEPLVNLV